jgi:electron transport complex protein RnfD
MRELTVSCSPHVHSGESIPKIMWWVTASLAPAAFCACYFFGLHASLLILVGTLSAVLTEALIQLIFGKRVTIHDGSAFLTGLLLAFNIPPTAPLWLAAVGSFVAIAFAKQAFGGLGQNIFNPALIGRAFLMASWPAHMTRWVWPKQAEGLLHAQTSATPLGILKMEGAEGLMQIFRDKATLYWNLYVGNVAGCIGETSALALLIGALILFYKGYITWHTPICCLLTVAIFSLLLGQDPLFHLLSGGLILGAFFMATDMVTSPITGKGRILFGIMIGALVMIIRVWGGYPEGVSYAILLGNAATPLIDRVVKPKRYGL